MTVTIDEVRHIAMLARLGVTDERAAALAGELNGILDHMKVLSSVDTSGVQEAIGVGARGLPTRSDSGPPIPLDRTLDVIAPRFRDGFLLVPRLASHGETEES